MRPASRPAKILFCLAAATTAAAIADPLVEALSNRGAFGPGNFTDHSNLDVIPALLAGLVFCALLVTGIVRRTMGPGAVAPAWLQRAVPAGGDETVFALLPAIFALQLSIVFAMETIEQIVITGEPLGGVVWLGAPFLYGLATHALACVLFAYLLAHTLRWSAQTIAAVVFYLRLLLCALVPHGDIRTSFERGNSAAHHLDPILARLRGRAPPFLSA